MINSTHIDINSPVMFLNFTKGVIGVVRYGKIHLNQQFVTSLNIGKYIQGEEKYDIEKIEEKYNILYLGQEFLPFDEKNWKFEYIGNTRIVGESLIIGGINGSIHSINSMILNKLMPDTKVHHTILYDVPGPIYDGGLTSDTKISKDELQKIYEQLQSDKLKIIDNTDINKIFYIHDILSVTNSISTHFKDALEMFKLASSHINKLSLLHSHLQDTDPRYDLIPDIDFYEIKKTGDGVPVVFSLLSATIIKLCSTLDRVSRVFHHFLKFKHSFDKIPKIENKNYNTKYFKELSGLDLFKKRRYRNLFSVRDEIIHNGYLDDIPIAYFGKGTSVVNNESLEYTHLPLFDMNENSLVVWINRRRFYSTDNNIQHFIVQEIKKITKDMVVGLRWLNESIIEQDATSQEWMKMSHPVRSTLEWYNSKF
jgi:hypothetical protein